MKKAELIKALEPFASGRTGRTIGQPILAEYFVDYLKRLEIPQDTKYDFWRIDDYLPQIIFDMLEDLRESQSELATRCRQRYDSIMYHEFPNVTQLGESRLLDQCSPKLDMASMIRTILEKLHPDWKGYADRMEEKIEAYLEGEHTVLQQRFDRFLRLVYRKGLHKIIFDASARGMNGHFGNTELRSYILAGRLMLTFARKNGKKDELSMSFIADESCPLGLSAGLQSIYADLPTGMSMLDEVVAKWPADPEEQLKVFTGNEKIMLDAVAAMHTQDPEKK